MEIIGLDTLKLKTVSTPVQNVGNHLRTVVAKLRRVANSITIDWAGLSAPQVGLFKRVFVLRNFDRSLTFCINPEITWASEELVEMDEYCLSVPIIGVKIKRPKEIIVTYTTDTGALVKDEKLTGLMARAFQHELDHLNGILITDYLVQKDGEDGKTEELSSVAVSES